MRVPLTVGSGAFVLIGSLAPLAADSIAPPPHPPHARAAVPRGTQTFYTNLAAFEAAAPPNLVLEDLQDGDVAAGGTTICSTLYDHSVDDACWDVGDIRVGVAVGAIGELGGSSSTAIFGANANGYGNPTIETGADLAADAPYLFFDPPVSAVGLQLRATVPAEDLFIQLSTPDGPFSETQHAVTSAGQFLGVVSTEPIYYLLVQSPSGARELIDDVRFPPHGDVGVDVSAPDPVGGVFTFTIAVTNHGPYPVTGIESNASLSARLEYVSNDCGGIPGEDWTWSVGNLAAGASATCHLTANQVETGSIVFVAEAAGIEPDTDPGNNADAVYRSAPGPGPSTPETGFALFRSFPDVTIPDETGAPFSFRAHADKLMIVQVCAMWCPPCRMWTEQSPELQEELAEAIGADNFLLVDMLVDRGTPGLPSTQENASDWKDEYDFPGPVLHAEGSATSALRQLYDDLWIDYNEAGALGIPYFFILAPHCDNQVAVRGLPNLADGLGEEVEIDTSTIDHVADLAKAIWSESRCAQPLLHRLDRCSSSGEAPILLTTATGAAISAAESFSVPPGQTFRIAAAHAVVEHSSPLLFDVDVYADAAGLPGAPVCSYDAVTPVAVHDSWVRRMELSPRCVLAAGNYWFALEPRDAPDDLPAWRGGVLPLGPEYAFRDTADQLATGCTDWALASECFGAGATEVELCYDLEAAPGIFADGFELNDTEAWSAEVP